MTAQMCVSPVLFPSFSFIALFAVPPLFLPCLSPLYLSLVCSSVRTAASSGKGKGNANHNLNIKFTGKGNANHKLNFSATGNANHNLNFNLNLSGKRNANLNFNLYINRCTSSSVRQSRLTSRGVTPVHAYASKRHAWSYIHHACVRPPPPCQRV